MPYKNIEDKRERDRRNAKLKRQRKLQAKKDLNPEANQALFLLYDAARTGELLLDIEDLPSDARALGHLAKAKLAKKVDRGIWRITLKGIVHVRQNYSVT